MDRGVAMRYRCKACRGVYVDITEDGARYFHACPPIKLVRVQRLGAWMDVPLEDLRDSDIVRVRREHMTLEVPVLELHAIDQRLGDTEAPRANRRDENPEPGEGGRKGRMRAEGAGSERI